MEVGELIFKVTSNPEQLEKAKEQLQAIQFKLEEAKSLLDSLDFSGVAELTLEDKDGQST